MSVKLLTEHHSEFLSFKGECTGLSESTLVKMPHCWKSHVTAHIIIFYFVGVHESMNHIGSVNPSPAELRFIFLFWNTVDPDQMVFGDAI